MSDLRLSAYLMAADVAWVEKSLASYYDIVDTVVVSYDEAGRGWTGERVDFSDNLARIRAVDSDDKVIYLPGDFGRTGHTPMENDTNQREQSLAAAGENADWVLQFDTDEVLLDPQVFLRELGRADSEGRDGLEFPARWFYAALADGRYLERTRRFWGYAASYPGPVAVRPGTPLHTARQGPGSESVWHVDFRRRNTDPWRNADTRIDAVISPDEGIAHFSWVRSEAELRAKAAISGHAYDWDWQRAINRWLWSTRHPWLRSLSSPLTRDREWWMRISPAPDGE